MSTNEKSGFKPVVNADDLVTIVGLWENGVCVDSAEFELELLMDSPIFNLYLVRSIWNMLGARHSGLKGLEKLEAARATFELWVEGEWEGERAKRGAPLLSVEVEALMLIKGVDDVAQAQKTWATLDKTQRAHIVSNPNMVEAIATIKERRASMIAIDVSDLLPAD